MTELPRDVRLFIGDRTPEECAVEVIYTNHRGVTARRKIIPLEVFIGSTVHHLQRQYLLQVWDLEKQAHRTYALADIKEWAHYPTLK